mmetsp:Transcript_8376/g.18071  ORF Transcript_8376/g.18071 Transcript_8376/m.18071 type:complete len:220 (+) Transcript_8376:141-800(+)
MAHRSIELAKRGFGLTARQFQAASVRSVAAFTPSSSNNNNNATADLSLRIRFFDNSGSNNHQRSYSSTAVSSAREYKPSPLDAFRDPVGRQTRMEQPVGRQWSVKELRRKSYEDLHRLWYVLYKEKNMLLTEQQLSRRRQLIFPQPDRFKKVQKSMGAIRQVLGERKRETVAAHLVRHEEKELAKQMTAEMDTQDVFESIDEASLDDSDGDNSNKDTSK